MLSHWLLLWYILIVIIAVNCQNFDVKTESGSVRGVPQTALLNHKKYIAFKAIPYAQPPVGNLRFKVPVPVTPWRETLLANEYGNSCLVIYQSQLFPLNSTQMLPLKKDAAKKAVMFFIHGGAFTEGDGADVFYGPDFIIDEDVLLVTINYRLGPWGFSNFDLKGFTGNMGFKDQQLALEWIKRNIKYFGGDPNSITVFGESAGGVSVHLHMLSERSRKCMKRAIIMSGVAMTPFAHYQPNNHIQLYKEIFGLDAQATAHDVLEFMLNAPVNVILEKTPVISINRNVLEVYFTAVYEDVTLAGRPFLTQSPQNIYKTNRINVEAMMGDTTAEFLLLLNPFDHYSWIEPMKNYSNIGLPFHGLTLSIESFEYREAIKKIYEFYFGTRELLPTVENLNIYIQMCSDMNFVYPTYVALKTHSQHAKTFCYQDDVVLGLNAVKMLTNTQELDGMAHYEDLHYLFRSSKYANLYDDVLANPQNVTNWKTLRAIRFITEMYTNFAKTGYPGLFGKFTQEDNNCIGITNDGLKGMLGLRKQAMAFWDSIYNSVKRFGLE